MENTSTGEAQRREGTKSIAMENVAKKDEKIPGVGIEACRPRTASDSQGLPFSLSEPPFFYPQMGYTMKFPDMSGKPPGLQVLGARAGSSGWR